MSRGLTDPADPEWNLASTGQPRRRRQEVLGVRVLRLPEERGRSSAFDHLARVHHERLVGHPCDDPEIVADQEQREGVLAPDLVDQREQLGLDGRVQGARWLVGDQQLGPMRQTAGEHRALQHPAAEVVGIVVQPVLGIGDPHTSHVVDQALAALGPGPATEAVEKLGRDRTRRVPACGRVLKHHREAPSSELAQPAGPCGQQIRVAEGEFVRAHGRRRLEEPGGGEHRRRLPRAGFADERDAAARGHGERDAVDGVIEASPIPDSEVSDRQDGAHSAASASSSPSRTR